MKIFMLCLLASSALACPVFKSDYVCSHDEYESNFKVSFDSNNKIYSFTGNMSIWSPEGVDIKVDGNMHPLQDYLGSGTDEKWVSGFYVATCKENTLEIVKRYDFASKIDNSVIANALEINSLFQNDQGHLKINYRNVVSRFGGDNFEESGEYTCIPR